MNSLKIIRRARLGTALAAVALSLGAVGAATPAAAAKPLGQAGGNAEPEPGHGHAGAAFRPDDRRVRRQRFDRGCPGALGEPAVHLRQDPRRDHDLRDQQVGPRGLCGQCPGRQEHQLDRRDASPGDARRERRRDADEQPRPADRHRGLARRCRDRASGSSPDLSRQRHHLRGRQPAAHGNAAAGDAQGQDRRGQPLDAEEDRRQSADLRPDQRLQVRYQPGRRHFLPTEPGQRCQAAPSHPQRDRLHAVCQRKAVWPRHLCARSTSPRPTA